MTSLNVESEYDNFTSSLWREGQEVTSLEGVVVKLVLFSVMVTISVLTAVGNALVLYAVHVNVRLQTVSDTCGVFISSS
jgi:hypothetical protein